MATAVQLCIEPLPENQNVGNTLGMRLVLADNKETISVKE
jgi:hypothetical protein